MHYTAESGSKRAGERRKCGEVVEEVCVCVRVCVWGGGAGGVGCGWRAVRR